MSLSTRSKNEVLCYLGHVWGGIAAQNNGPLKWLGLPPGLFSLKDFYEPPTEKRLQSRSSTGDIVGIFSFIPGDGGS